MNYEKIYAKLIEHRKNNPLSSSPQNTSGIEKHHVIPRSIRPDLAKDKDNIVALSYKEHFLAHHLLVKICLQQFGSNDWRTIKMSYAFKRMCFDKKHNMKITMKQYDVIKNIVAQDTSNTIRKYWNSLTEQQYKKFVKSHIHYGKENGMYGKGYLLKGDRNGAFNKKWIYNPITKEQKYVDSSLVVQYENNGWRLGLIRKSKGTTGTKWINNGTSRKSVPLDQISKYLNAGWRLGFRIK